MLGSLVASAPAHGDTYSWVDAQGGIHFTDVDPKKGLKHPIPGAVVKAGERIDGFGGQPPLVMTLNGGEERQLFPVDVDRYDDSFRSAATHYNLPFAFLKAVAKVESNFDARAVSPRAAKGIMQLMDGTAQFVDVADPFDPEQAIYGGARYLRHLANLFAGDVSLTAAAYNAGPEAVKKAGGVPAFDETEHYVERVLYVYRHYQRGD